MKQSVVISSQSASYFGGQKATYKQSGNITFKVGCNAYVNVIDAAAEHRETGLPIKAYMRDEAGQRVDVTSRKDVQETIAESMFLAPKPAFIDTEENP
jgi:endonuclease V-like protein UPF0215 family